MTKGREKGEYEITREAKRQAARTGRSAADILAEMRRRARAAKDSRLRRKIVKAEKYFRERNQKKRKRGS